MRSHNPTQLFAYRGIVIPLLGSYWGGSQGLSSTYEQAHVDLDLLNLASINEITILMCGLIQGEKTMEITVREFRSEDTKDAIAIWNEVVDQGKAFPQLEDLGVEDGEAFFKEQSYTGIAVNENDEIVGLYILHPNNIGRCGHICNASYAVKSTVRGQGVGRELVTDCLGKAKKIGFRVIQFNAVVKSNTTALALYKKLGFTQLGTIPGGFLNKDGVYEDIIVHYKEL